MKKAIRYFFLASLLLIVSFFFKGWGPPLIAADASDDVNPPQLKNIYISPVIVNPGSYFTVNISATDDSSGVKAINVILESPSGKDLLHKESYYIDSTGSWSANILMPAGVETGAWKVKSIYLSDNSGKSKNYFTGINISQYFTVSSTTTATAQTTATSASSVCTSFTYSDWSDCQKNGMKARTIVTSYPTGCTGGVPSLSDSCTNCVAGRPYLDQMNKDNCTSSSGTWTSDYCVCSCPTGYKLSGTGCLYSPPASISTSTSTTTTTANTTTATTCSFTYSDWSQCQSTGIRTRTVLTSYPTGCTGGTPSLTETCIFTATSSTTSTTTSKSANTSTTASTSTIASNTTSNTTTATTCSFTYSDWSQCQSTGIRTRTVLTSYPTGCTGGTPSSLSETCTYFYCSSTSSLLNEMNRQNCIDSTGTWNSSDCSCSCPIGYKFQGTECLYVPPVTCSFTYSDWTECKDGKQSRTVLSKYPDGCVSGTQESLSRYCLIDSACQKDEWTCNDWTECKDGKQTRSCNLSFDCPGISEISPKTEQTCTVSTTTTENTVTYCSYKYSGYGDCQDGKQSRKITSKYPDGCIEKNAPEALEKTCTSMQTNCSYVYSSWSDCKDGKKTRNVVSKTPDGCLNGNPIVEEKCQNICTDNDWQCDDWGTCGSEGMQYRKCSMSQSCLYNKTLTSLLTTRSCVYKFESNVATPQTTTSEVKTAEEELPSDCAKSGWTDKKDCELYLYHSRLVSDCRSSGLATQDQCREWLLSKYGKPLKCDNLSDESCNALINNVLLSDMATVMSSQVKKQLAEVAGMVAVINTENKTITVEVPKEATTSSGGQVVPATKETKEVKVDNLPIASSGAEQVSVSLVPTQVKTEQQNLSPVAIAFDSDGDGLPDDVEIRLGTDPHKKDTDSDGYTDYQELQMGTDPLSSTVQKSKIVMAGIDKAIVNGKALEQPKYSTPTASTALAVSSVATVKTEENKPASNNLKFEGKAEPNQVVTLFIYSTMPIVVTVQADANGNWTYELDKTMVDGTHEVYVAVNNDEGKIIESSLPTPFFIQQAQAVSVDDFVATGDATQVASQVTNMMMLYVLSGLAVVLVLIAAFLIIKQRFAE